MEGKVVKVTKGDFCLRCNTFFPNKTRKRIRPFLCRECAKDVKILIKDGFYLTNKNELKFLVNTCPSCKHEFPMRYK